jgi:putative transposase
MQRTNTVDVRPLAHAERLLLIEVLDASSACFNEVNYARRQAYFEAKYDDPDEYTVTELKTRVRSAVTQEGYRQKYIQTLGSAAPQQLVQKNWAAWMGFFELLSKYRNPEDDDVTDEPSPPGYWKDNGRRELHTVVRTDQYTLELGQRSRLEIPVGTELKEKYGLGHQERLRLEVSGRPRWQGKQGRLELVYDRDAESFTAHQTVGSEERPPTRRDSHTPALATADGGDSVVAAVDIGANTLAAVTTTNGDQLVFHGRPLFERFHRQTAEIARLQQQLDDDTWSSRRIRELYRQRGEQRNHAQDALVRQLAEWLAARGVCRLYAGRLDDIRQKHWSAVVNEKTDLFWAHGRFRQRLHDVLEGEYGIEVVEASEAGTSSVCPVCGSTNVHRCGDDLQCVECGFEGHSDVAGSVNFLVEQADMEGRPMARPEARGQNSPRDAVACLKWDDHRWRHRGHSTNEEPSNRSTHTGKLASGAGSGTT